jgi:hypothetical protein
VSDIKDTALFGAENLACDLYALSLKQPLESGKNYTLKLIKN